MLAEFKSTLPPRKRAKTKEEKEQRRVERILRNRRAAHASREKKRKHVEYLENYVLKLEANLEKAQGNLIRLSEVVEVGTFDKAGVVELDNLQQLKESIQLNMNSSGNSPEPVEGEDDDEDLSKEESNILSSPLASSTTTATRVEVEAEETLLSQMPVSSTTATPVVAMGMNMNNNSMAISSPLVNNNSNNFNFGHMNNMHMNMNMQNINNNFDMHNVNNLAGNVIQSNNMVMVKDGNSYYNYLSPISINSPMNSPIDLKLETEAVEYQQNMMMESSFAQETDFAKGFNSMGQNSEVILLPRNYESAYFSISI